MKIQERFRNKSHCRLSSLSAQEIKAAEVIILEYVQGQIYAKEVCDVKSGKAVGKSSSLKSLLPIISESGLLCVGGRLKHADVPNARKHPCIIPCRHPVAELIVREIHQVAHLGTEWTLSLLREQYWIINARTIIKKVKRSCVTCKKLFATPCVQQMADLPPERLEPNQPPFTYVGLDCFGPFYVKQGRSEVKRYGCIYTCLNIRAVHIEKLNSLETDTFLNGFRRFIARRGTPSKVWSDNGTNIVGCQAELAKGMRQLDESQIQAFSVQQEIEWSFNPPHASHMGGVWERLIRTVRKVLVAVMKDCRLTDEVLETLFCEVEGIVNSRPLTKISNDVNDMATLTPNHLLLLKAGPLPLPGMYHRSDMYRKRWRYIQYLADQFWRRWMREYLPELQRRNKWTDKQVNVKIGDVVLICDEHTPRSLWPLGLVVESKFGRDDLVRSVKVKTKSTVLVRPITKIVMLEES